MTTHTPRSSRSDVSRVGEQVKTATMNLTKCPETWGNPRMRLLVLFTFEMSLQKWKDAGILAREIGLYHHLVDSGVTTEFLTYGRATDRPYERALEPTFRFHRAFKNGLSNPWLRFFASWFIPIGHWRAVRRVDLVKTNQMWGAWVGLVSKILLGKKWILRCGFEHHRFLQTSKAKRREKVFSYIFSWVAYRVADVVVWSTEAERTWAMRHFSLRAADYRLRIVPNYVDTDLFTRQTLDLKSRRVLTVARLDPQKNLDCLIRALASKNLELDVVGDGPLYGELAELAHSVEVPVNFLGRVPNEQLPDLMRRARMFILVSHYEGNPKALLEAMACGIPVIGSDVSGTRDVVRHEVTGLLTGPDPGSIGEAIDRLLDDHELSHRLGQAAAQFVRKHYSLDVVAARERAAYRVCLRPHESDYRN